MSKKWAPVITYVTPTFEVVDLTAAMDFYKDVLDFGVGWTWGDPPNRASMCRDDVEVVLALTPAEAASTSSAYFTVENVDTYYKGVEAKGVEMLFPLEDRPYGMRDFAIADPSGNKLSFGEFMDRK